ncbi:hypothetical protein E4P40_15545 [Blastococcus sp. CT_GayMR20]|uniref:response regulator receiver domain n=1 Tax=Blastococcus sp. CT_GayMR20 TaxID=2559609 RepID=UPI001073F084|nr:response regulator receiver domain [Blastococcus sp. CT_GayMR20]TFV82797.1 hypothetical protein E4P40_15545 [Blastococcus sp. CT_GayMR20]
MSSPAFDPADPREFLRTALVVDDQALTADDREEEADSAADYALVPPDALLIGERDHGDAGPAQTGGAGGADGEAGGRLRTRQLVDAFADERIACAVLAPRMSVTEDRRRVIELAASTDILVIDWLLSPLVHAASKPDIGDRTSLQLIREIVQNDVTSGGRLRLICIYTSEPAIDFVLSEVAQGLSTLTSASVDLPFVADFDEGVLAGRNLMVRVVAKPREDGGVDGGLSESLLARFLVEEFVKLAATGLLPRLAIGAVASVRRHANRLLVRFGEELDAAFLSHRALTSPYAAEQYALSLVGDEITALLAATHVDAAVHEASVRKRTEELIPPSSGTRMLPAAKGTPSSDLVARAEAIRFIVEGAGSDSEKEIALNPTGSKKLKNHSTVTSLFFAESDLPFDKGRASDDAFGVLSCLARSLAHDGPGLPAPTLGLGTLLRRRRPSGPAQPSPGYSYWVCLMPPCDSVRLSEATRFPLIPLTEPQKGRFDIVIDDVGGHDTIRLKAKPSVLDLEFESFGPSDVGVVEAIWQERPKGWFFTSQSGALLRWMGDLRADQAYRLAVSLGSMLTRPGLDESEFVRVNAK